MLDQLELSASMKGFSFETDRNRLAVRDLEEDAQVVLANFFRVVKHMQVHLLTRSQRSLSWLDLEDFLIEDFLLKSLLLARSAGVSPSFHHNLCVVRHFESPVSLDPTNVLQRKRNLSWL